ncbi:hypothetical protein C8P68_103157 [Mucilaginibacter yixingensis]|uniref:Uncharacterized protein n=2 Tax=Mucilaginibacter yixingensis TaxID=1295612 RepID=A0A2T5JAV7_9SPHI|nr:hypothetical protein C8P68_103157 [Mucilaginibacter yixingensis]
MIPPSFLFLINFTVLLRSYCRQIYKFKDYLGPLFTNRHYNMKRNILNGIILISALALGSCSTQKLASNQGDDDVYNTNARAGDSPEYIARSNAPVQDRYYNDGGYDDDYYYYDSYASRINRFSYYSPFNYYDNLYYGYSPYYYGGVGWSPYLGYGLGIGIGYGGYYGYSPYWGLGSFYDPLYYGYGYGYSPYSYWGIGYGYGGGYWGIYSANNRSNITRPSRLGSTVGGGMIGTVRGGGVVPGRGDSRIYPDFVPNRPSRIYGTTGTNGGRTMTTTSSRQPSDQQTQRPTYTPTERPSYTPSSSSSNSSGGGGGGGRSSGGGGGGSRPGRP